MRKITFALMLLFAAALAAPATTLQQMNLDDLTAQSHAVVYGKIVASRAAWDRTHSVIYTFYTVQPIQYLKGQLGSSFELQEMGGELDGLVVRVPSAPVFNLGDEEVLFVWTDALGRHLVIGMEQGAVGVQTDPRTGQKTLNRTIRLGSARATAAGADTGPVTSRLLPQLFDQIRVSVAKAAAANGASK